MDLMKTKILITGASGCIGQALVKFFSEKYGCYIRAMVRTDNGELFNGYPNVEVVSGDIKSQSFLEEAVRGMDIVLHLAAMVHKDVNNKDEENEFYLVNTDASINLFRLSYKHQVKRVVFFSTIAVYGSVDGVVPTEDSGCNPDTVYGKSKLLAEEELRKISIETGLQYTILRVATVFGKNDRGNVFNLLNLMKKGLSVCADRGNNRKTFIYVRDLCCAVEKVIQSDNANNETFIVKGFEVKVREFQKEWGKFLSNRYLTLFIPSSFLKILKIVPFKLSLVKKIEKQLSVLKSDNRYSDEKIKRVCNFYPLYDVKSAIKDCHSWYLDK